MYNFFPNYRQEGIQDTLTGQNLYMIYLSEYYWWVSYSMKYIY